MTWDWSYVWEILPLLLKGLWITVQASLLASVIALGIGLLVAIIRYQKWPIVTLILTFIIDFVRGTPLLVQLFVVFYVLPEFGLTLSPFVAGVTVLGLHYSAYAAEIYRAGIEQVPPGQWDACAVLGIPKSTKWFRIIIPQAIRPIGPTLGNYVIVMFKESALLSVITVNELMGTAMNEANLTYRYLETFTMVGLLFWVISYPCARALRAIERRGAVSYE